MNKLPEFFKNYTILLGCVVGGSAIIAGLGWFTLTFPLFSAISVFFLLIGFGAYMVTYD